MRISDWRFRRVLFRSAFHGGAHGRRPHRERRTRPRGRLAGDGRRETGRRQRWSFGAFGRRRPGLGATPARRAAPARPHPFHRADASGGRRSEEHTSELQSLMRLSYAGFCLKKKKKQEKPINKLAQKKKRKNNRITNKKYTNSNIT